MFTIIITFCWNNIAVKLEFLLYNQDLFISDVTKIYCGPRLPGKNWGVLTKLKVFTLSTL